MLIAKKAAIKDSGSYVTIIRTFYHPVRLGLTHENDGDDSEKGDHFALTARCHSQIYRLLPLKYCLSCEFMGCFCFKHICLLLLQIQKMIQLQQVRILS
jgi:hypothetical protein